MKRYGVKLFCGLILLLWPLLLFAQSITLTQIKSIHQNQQWEFIFVTPVKVSAHSFLLPNPNRLVLDINGVDILHHQISAALLTATPVSQIRSSHQNKTLRVVFDLKQPVQTQTTRITADGKSGYRLEIVLRSVINVAAKTSKTAVAPVVSVSQLRKGIRPILVVIDPGHGGKDPGASGSRQVHEKDVVLSIAKKLQFALNKQRGFKAVLTRDDDYYLTLRERLAIARKYKADMFIAIHADAYPDPTAQGVSVFALSQRGATSEAARWMAARENQSELMGGVDLYDKENMLRSVLLNLSQSATIQASLLIGQNLLDNIHGFARLHHDHLEQAAFVVLKSPDIPSLLLETGFLSNAQEERKLCNQQYQSNLAYAVMLGIKKYFSQRPPPGTLLAVQNRQYKNN